ncbi:MAG: hypothetical protein ACP5E9_09695 [Candidatus Methanospirareceae archaeon]
MVTVTTHGAGRLTEVMPMRLKDILDEVITKDVYKKMPVKSELIYTSAEIPDEDVERMRTDKIFKEQYLRKLSRRFRELGYRDLKILDIDPDKQYLIIQYTGWYTGCRKYPEVHLKTLLILHDAIGRDISNPEVYNEIVETVRQDLGERERKASEQRLDRFARLFKRAIDAKYVRG